MKKYFLFPLLLQLFFGLAQAQLKSPSDFLGYPLGTRHTPHHLVQRYMEYVAATLPDQVQLREYGRTQENRPLLFLAISAAKNLSRLEEIRKTNLALTSGSVVMGAEQLKTLPAIVWLSYNVHGNEASSTEAAMLTLYELLREGSDCRVWLSNTVVLIDPCLNPDGRDRYVNWYQSVVGNKYNANPLSREHQEPWPGGRSNHYYFDLNRDWAWLTQTESQQRIKLYRSWMPHVHVDLHEQGYNEPYYFAPAAEPYHEIITPWQRKFQQDIGANHARYFDQNGWLYFTRERFDLLYPSYGDTYPVYNGSIGMTYEQGGIRAGLGIVNEDGDTLTLYARLTHHVTTSLSTIEVSARQQQRLVQEFASFFENARTKGMGSYKSFVIKADARREAYLQKLLTLLDAHGIEYKSGTAATAKGYNYATAKEETFSVTSADVVINTAQANAALVQVLFEPRTKLADSATYDITAWSLPYAYGLHAYATKEKVMQGANWKPSSMATPATTYGYALSWTSPAAASFAARLLQAGVKLRYAEDSFMTDGKKFDPGTVLILKTSNERWGNMFFDKISAWANEQSINLVPLSSGLVQQGSDFGSDKVHAMRAPRVALLSGEGTYSLSVGEVWHFFERQLNYPVTLLNLTSFSSADLAAFDVLVLAEGRYRFLDSKESFEGVQKWIQGGGRLIVLGETSAQLAKLDLGLAIRKDDNSGDKIDSISLFKNRERDEISAITTGSIWRISLDASHPLGFGYPGYYYSLKTDGTIFESIKDGKGWNVGQTLQEGPLAGFVGSRLQPKLKGGVLIGQLPIGRGNITFFADNILFRNFWENGKLLFCNALFFDAR